MKPVLTVVDQTAPQQALLGLAALFFAIFVT